MKSPTSRTTLITAVAVAGVLIAGTAAVAANVGILNASDDSSIGALSATDDLVPSTTLVPGTPILLEQATTTEAPTTTVADGASYVVDVAGTVTVNATPTGLELLDAGANPGWTPAATQPDSMSLRVAFDNGSRTVVFTATLAADGTITADVTEPIIVVAPRPNTPITTPPAYSDDDSHDDDSHDDDSHDDDSHDDDSHEYEGADDDD